MIHTLWLIFQCNFASISESQIFRRINLSLWRFFEKFDFSISSRNKSEQSKLSVDQLIFRCNEYLKSECQIVRRLNLSVWRDGWFTEKFDGSISTQHCSEKSKFLVNRLIIFQNFGCETGTRWNLWVQGWISCWRRQTQFQFGCSWAAYDDNFK